MYEYTQCEQPLVNWMKAGSFFLSSFHFFPYRDTSCAEHGNRIRFLHVMQINFLPFFWFRIHFLFQILCNNEARKTEYKERVVVCLQKDGHKWRWFHLSFWIEEDSLDGDYNIFLFERSLRITELFLLFNVSNFIVVGDGFLDDKKIIIVFHFNYERSLWWKCHCLRIYSE